MAINSDKLLAKLGAEVLRQLQDAIYTYDLKNNSNNEAVRRLFEKFLKTYKTIENANKEEQDKLAKLKDNPEAQASIILLQKLFKRINENINDLIMLMDDFKINIPLKAKIYNILAEIDFKYRINLNLLPGYHHISEYDIRAGLCNREEFEVYVHNKSELSNLILSNNILVKKRNDKHINGKPALELVIPNNPSEVENQTERKSNDENTILRFSTALLFALQGRNYQVATQAFLNLASNESLEVVAVDKISKLMSQKFKTREDWLMTMAKALHPKDEIDIKLENVCKLFVEARNYDIATILFLKLVFEKDGIYATKEANNLILNSVMQECIQKANLESELISFYTDILPELEADLPALEDKNGNTLPKEIDGVEQWRAVAPPIEPIEHFCVKLAKTVKLYRTRLSEVPKDPILSIDRALPKDNLLNFTSYINEMHLFLNDLLEKQEALKQRQLLATEQTAEQKHKKEQTAQSVVNKASEQQGEKKIKSDLPHPKVFDLNSTLSDRITKMSELISKQITNQARESIQICALTSFSVEPYFIYALEQENALECLKETLNNKGFFEKFTHELYRGNVILHPFIVALNCAIRKNNIDAVKYVINLLKTHQISITSINEYRQTPLMIAAEIGNPIVIALLLKEGASPLDPKTANEVLHLRDIPEYRNPMAIAARHGHLDALKCMISSDSLPEQTKFFILGAAFFAAAHMGQVHILEHLLTIQKDLYEFRTGGLINVWMAAASKGQNNVLEFLLNCQASPKEYAKKVMNERKDLNVNILMFAVESGNMTTVNLVLSYCDKNLINAVDANGNTPLHIAAINGDDVMLGFLIHNGARLGIKANDRKDELAYSFESMSEEDRLYVVNAHHLLDSIQNPDAFAKFSWLLPLYPSHLSNDEGSNLLHLALSKPNENLKRYQNFCKDMRDDGNSNKEPLKVQNEKPFENINKVALLLIKGNPELLSIENDKHSTPLDVLFGISSDLFTSMAILMTLEFSKNEKVYAFAKKEITEHFNFYFGMEPSDEYLFNFIGGIRDDNTVSAYDAFRFFKNSLAYLILEGFCDLDKVKEQNKVHLKFHEFGPNKGPSTDKKEQQALAPVTFAFNTKGAAHAILSLDETEDTDLDAAIVEKSKKATPSV